MNRTCWINVYPPLLGDKAPRYYAEKHPSRAAADRAVSRMFPRLYIIRCTPKERAR